MGVNKNFEITESDFKLVYNGYNFDLYFKHNSGWKISGYGLSLQNCIKNITYNRINLSSKEYNLNSFLKKYESITNSLKVLIQDV